MTANILHFPAHQWAHCTNKHCTGCHLCHGGLAVCKRCGGMEGGLPTHCPGERMTMEQGDAVYAGKQDWINGLGWVAGVSRYSPMDQQ